MRSFSGWTAAQYVEYRRDVPDAVIAQIVDHFHLVPGDCVLDLGAGTGQLLIPLVRRLGRGIGLDPEPDMLWRLRSRALAEHLDVVCVLGAAEELPTVQTLVGDSISLVTVANALHWMDATAVFEHSRQLLRPGGGIAVVSHGLPLWLADTDWAQAMNNYLQTWFGASATGMCGLDDATRHARAKLLREAGFGAVTELQHHYRATLTPRYIVGHLYSALSEHQVPTAERANFEQGLLDILNAYESTSLTENVPVMTLTATTPR